MNTRTVSIALLVVLVTVALALAVGLTAWPAWGGSSFAAEPRQPNASASSTHQGGTPSSSTSSRPSSSSDPQGDCGLQFPWIEPALRKFATPMFNSARRSTQSNEAALNVSAVQLQWTQEEDECLSDASEHPVMPCPSRTLEPWPNIVFSSAATPDTAGPSACTCRPV